MFAMFSRFSSSLKHGPTSTTSVHFSGVSRDMDQGVETCLQVPRESHPDGTDGDRRRAVNRLNSHKRRHGSG